MSAAAARGEPPRYSTLLKIASGGMATVFVGHAAGIYDMRRLVAIKRPHPHLIEDESFSRSLLAEANLASRIHHPNVVSVRDVEVHDDSMHLVMDYIEGISLVELIADGPKVMPREALARVGLRILLDACAGLHAAHELKDGNGRTLGLVHRDVSPHNILVGIDGVSRVVDFGIAKCIHQRQGMTTTAGTVKGKTAYMAPEYVSGRALDRRSDIFAMGILLWEVLAGARLFRGQSDAETITRVLTHTAAPVSKVAPFCGTRFDTVVGRALAKDPAFRHATMLDLADALGAAARGTNLVATHDEVSEALVRVAGERLEARRERVRAVLEREARETQSQLEEDDDAFGLTEPHVVQHDSTTEQKASSVTKLDVADAMDAPDSAPPTAPGPPAAPASGKALGSTVPLGAMSPAIGARVLPAATPSRPMPPAPVTSPTSEPFPASFTNTATAPRRKARSLFPVVLFFTASVFVGAVVLAAKLGDALAPKAAGPIESARGEASAPPIPMTTSAPAASTEATATASTPGATASASARRKPSAPARPATASAAVSSGATTAEAPPPPAPPDAPRPLPTNPYHR